MKMQATQILKEEHIIIIRVLTALEIKEDQILFPMAEQVIPPEQQEKVDADYSRTGLEEAECGVQGKYQALTEVLEKESTKRI